LPQDKYRENSKSYTADRIHKLWYLKLIWWIGKLWNNLGLIVT